jgi:hypothetical protein
MERTIIQGSIDYRRWEHLSAAAALKQHLWVEKTIASWKLPNELVARFVLICFASRPHSNEWHLLMLCPKKRHPSSIYT